MGGSRNLSQGVSLQSWGRRTLWGHSWEFDYCGNVECWREAILFHLGLLK